MKTDQSKLPKVNEKDNINTHSGFKKGFTSEKMEDFKTKGFLRIDHSKLEKNSEMEDSSISDFHASGIKKLDIITGPRGSKIHQEVEQLQLQKATQKWKSENMKKSSLKKPKNAKILSQVPQTGFNDPTNIKRINFETFGNGSILNKVQIINELEKDVTSLNIVRGSGNSNLQILVATYWANKMIIWIKDAHNLQ